MIRIYTAIIFITSQVSCMDANVPNKNYYSSENLFLAASASEPFIALEETCNIAGGQFLFKEKECYCDHSQVFIAEFEANDELNKIVDFRCEMASNLAPSEPAVHNKFIDILDKQGPEALISNLERVRYIGNRRILQLHIYPGINFEKLRELAVQLDDKPLPLHIPNGYQRGDRFDIYYYYPDIDRAHIRLAQQIPFHNFESTQTNHTGKFLYAWSYQDLARLLKGISASPATDPQTLVNPDRTLAHLYFARLQLEAYYQNQAHRLEDIDEKILTIDRDCQNLCIYQLSFRYHGHYFWLEKHYINGSVLQRLLFSGSLDQTRKDGVLVLGEGLQVSFALKNERILSEGQHNFLIRSHAYSENLVEKTFTDYSVFSDHRLIEEHLKDMTLFSESQKNPLILFGQFDLNDPEIASRLLKGPYSSPSVMQGGSMFGWMQTRAEENFAEAEHYYDGVFNFGVGIDPLHTKLVIEELYQGLDSREAMVIPLGYQSLFNGRFQEVFNLSRARLALLPATIPIRAEACQELLGGFGKDVLWILPAGNDGIDSPNFRCPQRLKPSEQRLVVGSGQWQELETESDYGTDYADIAAPGFAANGQRGTSYAAPKVARTANEIIHKYPSLSNQELRLAILLSVNFNPYSPLPLRSGGILNHDWALKAADRIGQLSTTDRNHLITGNYSEKSSLYKTIISSFSSLESHQINRQIRHLMKQGI